MDRPDAMETSRELPALRPANYRDTHPFLQQNIPSFTNSCLPSMHKSLEPTELTLFPGIYAYYVASMENLVELDDIE